MAHCPEDSLWFLGTVVFGPTAALYVEHVAQKTAHLTATRPGKGTARAEVPITPARTHCQQTNFLPLGPPS